jgi:hypothetical protein
MIGISNSISLSQDGYPVRQEYRFRYKHVDVKSAKAIAKKMIRRNWRMLNHGEKTHGARESCLLG